MYIYIYMYTYIHICLGRRIEVGGPMAFCTKIGILLGGADGLCRARATPGLLLRLAPGHGRHGAALGLKVPQVSIRL